VLVFSRIVLISFKIILMFYTLVDTLFTSKTNYFWQNSMTLYTLWTNHSRPWCVRVVPECIDMYQPLQPVTPYNHTYLNIELGYRVFVYCVCYINNHLSVLQPCEALYIAALLKSTVAKPDILNKAVFHPNVNIIRYKNTLS
jgi:hypothetical protein